MAKQYSGYKDSKSDYDKNKGEKGYKSIFPDNEESCLLVAPLYKYEPFRVEYIDAKTSLSTAIKMVVKDQCSLELGLEVKLQPSISTCSNRPPFKSKLITCYDQNKHKLEFSKEGLIVSLDDFMYRFAFKVIVRYSQHNDLCLVNTHISYKFIYTLFTIVIISRVSSRQS